MGRGAVEPRPHFAWEISWKRSFILRLGLLLTSICQENGAFRKRSSNRRNLKTSTLRFSVDGKRCENGAFRKRWLRDNYLISLSEFSSNTNSKWPVIVAFPNFSWRGVHGKHLMRFQSEKKKLRFYLSWYGRGLRVRNNSVYGHVTKIVLTRCIVGM